jgi:iduronate 2-sulfatase
MSLMFRARFRRTWILALIALLGQGHWALAEAPTKARLNVLFIAADDLNTRLGCYGAPYVKTPNVDRLAARGVRFDRAFYQYPVCNGSRTSILSGLYPDTTQIFGNAQDPRQKLPDAVLLPELFKQNGYFTAGFGKIAHGAFPNMVKWDLGGEARGGRDDDEGGPRPAAKAQVRDPAKKAARKAAAKKKAAAVGPNDVPFAWSATSNTDAQEVDGQTARQIARLLDEHKAGPFFLAAGFHKPHVPHTAPAPYFDKYPVASMPLAPLGGDPLPRLTIGTFYPELSADQQRQIIAHYSAATSFMDAQLGVLLDTMDRLKLWENTVVVFWGDHGWHLGEHGGMWAKFTLMNESARVPLIVAAPGIRPGVASGLVELVDLYPTLAELCGLAPPSGIQGKSFAAQLENPSLPGKELAYTVVTRAQKLARGIRSSEFTYIENPDGTAQLFATSDSQEMHNLAGDPGHAATLGEMKRQLQQTVERATR